MFVSTTPTFAIDKTFLRNPVSPTAFSPPPPPPPAILMSILLPETSKVFPAPTKFNVLTVPIPSPPD